MKDGTLVADPITVGRVVGFESLLGSGVIRIDGGPITVGRGETEG